MSAKQEGAKYRPDTTEDNDVHPVSSTGDDMELKNLRDEVKMLRGRVAELTKSKEGSASTESMAGTASILCKSSIHASISMPLDRSRESTCVSSPSRKSTRDPPRLMRQTSSFQIEKFGRPPYKFEPLPPKLRSEVEIFSGRWAHLVHRPYLKQYWKAPDVMVREETERKSNWNELFFDLVL